MFKKLLGVVLGSVVVVKGESLEVIEFGWV